VAIKLPTHLQAALPDLGEGLGHLRLCNAEVQQAMERSLASHGQITPLVVCERARGYEVIDGFKRLRAVRALRWDALWVHVADVRGAAAKVQIVHSNRRESLTEIEEAWIIRALHREDGLSQPEIGRLLGHHKSWVNRRLLLAETLSEELQADLRLGLVGATTAHELCRLPRGNQREVGAVCVRRGLTTRQTQLLDAAPAGSTLASDATGMLARATRYRNDGDSQLAQLVSAHSAAGHGAQADSRVTSTSESWVRFAAERDLIASVTLPAIRGGDPARASHRRAADPRPASASKGLWPRFTAARVVQTARAGYRGVRRGCAAGRGAGRSRG
jgi:ParB/RepB/Spo0J family partition protein